MGGVDGQIRKQKPETRIKAEPAGVSARVCVERGRAVCAEEGILFSAGESAGTLVSIADPTLGAVLEVRVVYTGRPVSGGPAWLAQQLIAGILDWDAADGAKQWFGRS